MKILVSSCISIVVLGGLGAIPARASISYGCASNIDSTIAGTCSYLNTSISGLYSSSFSNANASIYIQYGTTGLGESTSGYLNLITYSAYVAALNGTASADGLDAAALASLPATEPAVFNDGNIEVTSALGTALGLTGMVGITATGDPCYSPGIGGCYNGLITITDPASLLANYNQGLFYRNGSQASNAYDFYSVVEHETDEILGTESCIETGGSLSDGCGGTNASAADLFRYSAAGARVVQSTTPGAYFSYDGGVTNVATYNTIANGADYADWASSCQYVQDAYGCPGQSFDITTDGGPELKVLDAIGYNLNSSPTPEPSTVILFASGLGLLAIYRRRKHI